jgi:hypothetical protein
VGLVETEELQEVVNHLELQRPQVLVVLEQQVAQRTAED